MSKPTIVYLLLGACFLLLIGNLVLSSLILIQVNSKTVPAIQNSQVIDITGTWQIPSRIFRVRGGEIIHLEAAAFPSSEIAYSNFTKFWEGHDDPNVNWPILDSQEGSMHSYNWLVPENITGKVTINFDIFGKHGQKKGQVGGSITVLVIG